MYFNTQVLGQTSAPFTFLTNSFPSFVLQPQASQCVSVHQGTCLLSRLPSQPAHCMVSSGHPAPRQSVRFLDQVSQLCGETPTSLLCSWAAGFCWKKFRPCSNPPKCMLYKISCNSFPTGKDLESLTKAIFWKLKIVFYILMDFKVSAGAYRLILSS